MLKQTFDYKSLKRCLRKKDFKIHHLRYKNEEELQEELMAMSEEANDDEYSITSIRKDYIKRKDAYVLEDLTDNLVIRRVDAILRRIYKVKQANRSRIIHQIQSLLSNTNAFNIIRTDIKSFYESIPAHDILNKIKDDGIVSSKVCSILDSVFNNYKTKDQSLMRGISVSSTLSEIYMREFDKTVRTINGVFYYARYVDDIIVFSVSNPKNLLHKMKAALRNGLELSHNKTTIIYVPCKKYMDIFNDKFTCDDSNACDFNTKKLDYLGYRLEFECHRKNTRKPKKVSIRISPKKVKKIKTRITRAFIDYSHTHEYTLLKKRIDFLASNFRLSTTTRKSYLMSGIYYNYPLLTKPLLDLADLNNYYRKCIFANPYSFNPPMTLSTKNKNELKKISFEQGHRMKISNIFSAKEIDRITKCWRYE